jgi:hypothetical protein
MSFITIATQVTECRWTDCNIKGIKIKEIYILQDNYHVNI